MKDLTGAALDIVMGRAVLPEVAQERMTVCKGCKMFNGTRCEACGCFMKAKVGLPSAHCPLHKWPR